MGAHRFQVAQHRQVRLGAVEKNPLGDFEAERGGIDFATLDRQQHVEPEKLRVRGEPLPSFTVQIKARHLDESREAALVSRHLGASPVVVPVGEKYCAP